MYIQTYNIAASIKIQKLNSALLLFPNGYTTKALMNKPTVIPMAIWIMLYATFRTSLLIFTVGEEGEEEEETVPLAVCCVSWFADDKPLIRLPPAARPEGTWTKMAGRRAAAATPWRRRL